MRLEAQPIHSPRIQIHSLTRAIRRVLVYYCRSLVRELDLVT
jgi:hypothetical protein